MTLIRDDNKRICNRYVKFIGIHTEKNPISRAD